MKIPELNKIYCGDSLSILKSWPDEFVDCIVTSPPYDELRDYDGYSFNFEGIAKELYRVLKKGGITVWIVGDATIDGSETATSFKQALFFKNLGLKLYDTMIYEKNSFSHPSKERYYQVFEYMFILSKGTPRTINLLKDKKNKWPGSWGNKKIREKDGTLRNYKEKIVCGEFGIRHNVWKYNTGEGFSATDKIAKNHPAIFPEQLVADHIKSWSNSGDIILDPMCGSGTTLKMARLLNRSYLGIEISPKYVKLTEKRLAQQVLF